MAALKVQRFGREVKPHALYQAFQRALELDPMCIASRYQEANIKLMVGLREEAIEEFNEILARLPDYLPALKGRVRT